MATAAAPALPRPQSIDPSELRFDARNPRFSESQETTQEELLEKLWREFSVDEIALSIAANGFFEYEPIFAARETDELVVVEGNRRLAAVRLLLSAEERRRVGATDLPRVSQARADELRRLPVVVCARADVWQYVGFKHVNGPQPWRSHSKAQYIAWVHNELDVPLEDIAKQIGDRHRTVVRLYRALMAIDQAEEAGVFEVEDRARKHFAFSHLYTGLNYAGFQHFLDLEPEATSRRPVPDTKIQNLGELLVWLYGSKTRSRAPLIQSQNPDLRDLDETLQTDDGVAALRRGLGLRVARDIGRGDERLFREALLDARRALQEARGKMLTGYQGEPDLLRTGEEVALLANDIVDEMLEKQPERRRRRRSRS